MNLLHRIIFKLIKFPMFETTEKEKKALIICKSILNIGIGDTYLRHHGEFYLCLMLYRMAILGETTHDTQFKLKKKIDKVLGNKAASTLELYLSCDSFIYYCLGTFIDSRELRKEWIRQLLLYKP